MGGLRLLAACKRTKAGFFPLQTLPASLIHQLILQEIFWILPPCSFTAVKSAGNQMRNQDDTCCLERNSPGIILY